MSGYLGQRGILGKIRVEGSHWQVAFHFVDGGPDTVLAGDATPVPPDPIAEEELAMSGLPVHAYLDCELQAANAAGFLSDARCLAEEGTLEIDATWSMGKSFEPFYLRTRSADAIDPEPYLAALLSAPTPKHACAPFVEVLTFNEGARWHTVSYRLWWPCDPAEDPNSPGRFARQPAKAVPPSHEAYLADLSPNEPHRLLWSSKWATLPDRGERNVVQLFFAVMPFAPGLDLYVTRKSDEFQSPINGSGNSSDQVTVLAVSAQGRHGKPYPLPPTDSGRAGWCFTSSQSSTTWLLDLNADHVPELVTQTDQSERHDANGPDGPECVDGASKTSFVIDRLDAKTLGWTRNRRARGFTEAELSRGSVLSL